jgi:hypothetical protein
VPLWRHLFDPSCKPPHLFIGPIAVGVGVVFATIGGIFIGWEGIALGIGIGVVHGSISYARVMFVRWNMRRRGQAK